jgi:ferric-dicitrate binding protein FerR (iron transport regulator)
MTPPDSKSWWFAAAALTTAFIPLDTADAKQQAGVITTAAQASRLAGKKTKGGQKVVVGDQAQVGETFKTGDDGYIHILFLDQSSVTLGPNSALQIDAFSHGKAAGKIVLTLKSGSIRVVGGKNSKLNPTEVRTPDGKVEISGGITTISSQEGSTSAVFLFGQSMRVQFNDGNSQTVTRQGSGIQFDSGGLQDKANDLASNPLSKGTLNFDRHPVLTDQNNGQTPSGVDPAGLVGQDMAKNGGSNLPTGSNKTLSSILSGWNSTQPVS